MPITAHDKLLYECIRYLQENYPQFIYQHIPNELYSMISSVPCANGLWWLFEKGLGKQRAIRLKQILADAFVGVSDLVVFTPLGAYCTAMMGEIKLGADHVHKRQRQRAGGTLHVWNSIEAFAKDVREFEAHWIDLQKTEGCHDGRANRP